MSTIACPSLAMVARMASITVGGPPKYTKLTNTSYQMLTKDKKC
jgi:hypothetical protein